jgi:hypothetical protein
LPCQLSRHFGIMDIYISRKIVIDSAQIDIFLYSESGHINSLDSGGTEPRLGGGGGSYEKFKRG